MKRILKEYSHILLLLYFPIYLFAFSYVERCGSSEIHVIDCAIDHKIPFIEYFIIPYCMWFAYVGIAMAFFLFFEKESFKKYMYMGMIGMTIFIVISFAYPNGLLLRPTTFHRSNIFISMTKILYAIDTATNVFPSIHVYNSLAVHFTILRSERLKNNKIIQRISLILCVLIILSTMFLKQHSIYDVVFAMILFVIAYKLVYRDKIHKN